jgi:hypothetical protein
VKAELFHQDIHRRTDITKLIDAFRALRKALLYWPREDWSRVTTESRVMLVPNTGMAQKTDLIRWYMSKSTAQVRPGSAVSKEQVLASSLPSPSTRSFIQSLHVNN